jgi:hypothetical protein
MLGYKPIAATLSLAPILFAGAIQAKALTITGNVGSKYLLQ